jgi:hypothetical protein
VANSQIAVFKALGGGWEHARVSTSPAPARYPHKRRRPGGRRIGRNPMHQRRGTGRPVAM